MQVFLYIFFFVLSKHFDIDVLIPPFYRWKGWGSKSVKNLVKF